MWCIHRNRILFGLKKEENSDAYYNLDESQRHYPEWNTTNIWFYLYEVPRVVKFIQKVEWCFPWTGIRGIRDLLFDGYRYSVWVDNEVLGRVEGDGCKTMWMYLMTLSCTFKMVRIINLEFHHNRKMKQQTNKITKNKYNNL